MVLASGTVPSTGVWKYLEDPSKRSQATCTLNGAPGLARVFLSIKPCARKIFDSFNADCWFHGPEHRGSYVVPTEWLALSCCTSSFRHYGDVSMELGKLWEEKYPQTGEKNGPKFRSPRGFGHFVPTQTSEVSIPMLPGRS